MQPQYLSSPGPTWTRPLGIEKWRASPILSVPRTGALPNAGAPAGGDLSSGRWHERAPAGRWQDEPRSLADASFQVSRAGQWGPRLRGSPSWLPTKQVNERYHLPALRARSAILHQTERACPMQSHSILSIVWVFRTQSRNNGVGALRNAVVPLVDRWFARRAA
jgi:hypothetical protein